MGPSAHSEDTPGHPGARFDPYVRLIRSLLPHASCVTLFGAAGEFCWSTDPASGPDLTTFVDHALLGAHADPDHAGQLGLLAGNLPVYLWPLRDEAQQLLAILAVVCRAKAAGDPVTNDFSSTHALLAPVFECLTRELRVDSRPGPASPGEASADDVTIELPAPFAVGAQRGALPSRCAPEEEEIPWYAGAAR
jgi:hypothetical protein